MVDSRLMDRTSPPLYFRGRTGFESRLPATITSRMKETIEQQVSDAVLQEPYKVTLGGKEYTVARPTVATIIEVSKLVSQLPETTFQEGKDSRLDFILAYARDCDRLGDIAATLILGKKGLVAREKRVRKRFFGLFRNTEEVEVDRRAALSKELLENGSGEELLNLVRETIDMQHIAFFFSIITSLNGANILRKTRTMT